MELTQTKYKQTEVGLIPKDWEVYYLKDLAFFSQGVQVDLELQKKIPGLELERFIRIENYTQLSEDFRYIPKHLGKNAIIQEDDIAIVRYGATAGFIGRGFSGVLANNLFKVTPLHRLNKSFLFRYLKSYYSFNFFQNAMSGGAMPALSFGIAGNLPIPLPPTLTEQKAIATALSDVDDLIANLDKLITKKKAIKQGAMQQLLTPPHKGGKRLAGFTGEWVEKKLGDVGVCIRGVTYSGDSDLYPFDNANSIRLLRSNNVFDKNIVYTNLQYVKKERVKPLQIMQSKDILICMANGSKALVGKAGQYKGASNQYTFGAFMGVFRPNVDEWNADFIFNIFSTNLFRCHLDIQLSGSSINNLNPSDIEIFKFYFPSSPEQKAIAQILSHMDLEIEQLESKKVKYQDIKQGMMQELLTGKTRLV